MEMMNTPNTSENSVLMFCHSENRSQGPYMYFMKHLQGAMAGDVSHIRYGMSLIIVVPKLASAISSERVYFSDIHLLYDYETILQNLCL